ncbi:MAG: AAA family ATPase [Desulfovibrio sp.]|nr:AAA family ATPase [Desulfovibrio sp.]
MLEFLRIRNLALIEDMELEFMSGMNVLTGETGAGKSFILKALSFLLGDRLNADIVRTGAEKTQVEALFDLDDTEIIIRRELMAESGRSRLYINDTLSSQERLRDLRPRLISYTSQHAQHLLLQPAFQSRLAESVFPDPDLLTQRDALLAELQKLSQQRSLLEQRQTGLLEKREWLEMQLHEINKVKPEIGEEEHLETLRQQARAQKRLYENYDTALTLLYGEEGTGLLDLLGRFERLAQGMNNDSIMTTEAEAVSQLRQRLLHLSNHLRCPPLLKQDIDIDKIESRLFALSQLKRKLHRELPEILSLRDEIEQSLSFLDVCTLDISRIEREEKRQAQLLQNLLNRISPLRRASLQRFTAALEKELRELAFSDQVKVIPSFIPYELWPGINDERIRFLWAPNPGQPPQPLDRIASGGELSRFFLALTSVRQDAESATYIFDEVDSGIGGLTLNRLAKKLDALAERRQMILITHWPQLAAQARRHFQISKVVRNNMTFTLCSPLDAVSRQQELARMAGGGAQGEALARSFENSRV